MEKISLWCKGVAIISVVSSLILLLLPESKSKKTLYGVLAVIIVYVILSPISDSSLDFSFVYSLLDSDDSTSLSQEYDYYEKYPLIVTSESETEKYICGILSDYGKTGDCQVKCEYRDEKIVIREVIMTGDFSADDKEYIKGEINKICDGETSVVFREAEYE